jgi:hypothetical protein
MKRLFIAAVAALAMAVPAHAEIYTYACHSSNDFKLYVAKLDTRKKTITWKGSIYKNMTIVYGTASGVAPRCAFHATSRNGTADLRTATQGVASLTIAGGGPGINGAEAECDLVALNAASMMPINVPLQSESTASPRTPPPPVPLFG